MKKAGYIIGIILAFSGVIIIYSSLIISFLDSIGVWGYPKNFFNSLFWDRVSEPLGLGVKGLQFFHYLVAGLVISVSGAMVILLSTVRAIHDFFLEPWTFSYKLLGNKIERLLPYFRDLHTNLRTGGVSIAFPAYVSFMFIMTIVVFIFSEMVLFFLLPFIFEVELISLSNLFLSLMFAGLSSVITILIIYIYPGMKSSNRRIPIEANLPYISSFLTLLSSSNVPPRMIFHSLARIKTLREVRQEFSNIVRDVEVFGQDLLSSILENSEYMPCQKLKEILKGYVATITTGGNPTDYLRISTQNIMKEKMMKLDLMLESLSALAEIYIMVLVAMPLLFVVMFATLGMLGGGGTLNPVLMLYLLLYIGIPVLASILIVIVSTFTV